MYHEDLREWLLVNGLFWKDLAKTVGTSSLTHYTTTGKLFPGEWIEKWQEVYGWSDEQMFHFAFDRPFKPNPELFKSEKDQKALDALATFKEALRAM
uniref:Repressor protein C2/DNA Complex n=1 Tax=Firmicutes phage HS10 TaxID=3056392 RepID=A0AA49X3U9_9VIRU|nr:MAG: repressor protein C2/DNA Complex [Firmicutes phage HS10]